MSKKENPISFNLHKVTTEQFAMIKDSPESDSNISITTSYKLGCNKEKKAIVMFLRISFEHNAEPFLIIEIGCHFIIDADSWNSVYNDENDGLELPKGFVSHLMMISMGTVRGILHAKTENTPYNKFLIPLINVSEIIKEDVILCK